jgi:spermidine synthase
MKPWKIIARAANPGGDDLVLWQRDAEFVVRVGSAELMSSRRHGSEEAMATAALPAIARDDARVLIGGLGFGYTLRAALDRLGPGGRILVAEISNDIIEWNRGFLGGLGDQPMDDSRATVECTDLRCVLARASRTPSRGCYDAILVDVDNGPWPLVTKTNRLLWHPDGIAAIGRAMKPGAVLVVWSTGSDPTFVASLRAGGFAVEVKPVRAESGRGARHTLFIARRAVPR